MFRKLADIINPKQPKREFDLSDAEVEKLRDLRDASGYPVFLKTLDLRINIHGEAMLASQTIEKMWEMRGYIMGLRAAGLIVDEILQKEKELSEYERRRSDGNRYATDHVATALYGTPSWT